MTIGLPELIIVIVGLAAVAVPIYAVVDIAQQPDHAWRATGRSRRAWLFGIIAAWVFGLGAIGAVLAAVYLLGPRRELRDVASCSAEGGPPGSGEG